jgi:hypothetical protein
MWPFLYAIVPRSWFHKRQKEVGEGGSLGLGADGSHVDVPARLLQPRALLLRLEGIESFNIGLRRQVHVLEDLKLADRAVVSVNGHW